MEHPKGKGRAKPTDVHIGKRLRRLREARRMSQEVLGAHVGVTFQQIQKYEKGDNRIGGSTLYKIATAFGVTPQYFFLNLPGMGEDQSLPPEIDINRRTLRLAEDIDALTDKSLVKGLRCLVNTVKYARKDA